MRAMLLQIVPVLVAGLCLLWALGLRSRLAEARDRASRAEQSAAVRARSLSLGAQELRGIAARMSGCAPAPGASLCSARHGVVAEGPAHQLLRLADDLAEVAAGPGERVIREAPAQLGAVVDAAIGTVERQISPARRHWQVDAALRKLTVKADGRALQGALAALLRRAASHSRDGEVISLRWVVASETMAIVVEDEGDGLAAPDLQPDSTAASQGTRGLDLGLSLARSLAAAHGGDIRLETAPGIGARAWLTLPRTRLLDAA